AEDSGEDSGAAYIFTPEPDEDESVLPGEEVTTEAAATDAGATEEVAEL
ncbi:hypothetical protein LCGC14_2517310, partial [marine sediment metagenome]